MAKAKSIKLVVLVLKGWNPAMQEECEALFTSGEKATALAVAAAWDARGYKPWLFSKTYDGDFKTLYNWESRAKAKVRKKVA